ncbi:hypothetical protein RP20_CCG019490 [Aedes albopictus]|nr:hypothetical protein RP20_CCG019490 [Aedes albopictus]
MAGTIPCIILVLYLTFTSSDWISPVLLDYSLLVIEHFYNQPGRFECILYDIGGGRPFDNWFIELLQSPRLFHIPHYVINMNYSETESMYLTRDPTLVVINLRKPDDTVESSRISSMFLGLNPHTRIVVLFAGAYLSFMKEIARYFTSRQTLFTRVVFIEIRILKVVRTGFDGGIVDFTDLVNPPELFRSLLRNMEGRPLRYTAEGRLSLMDRNWMEGSAGFLNASVEYMRSPCDGKGEALFMACFEHHLTDSRVIISVTLREFTQGRNYLRRLFFGVFPMVGVVAVPKGRAISVTGVLLCTLRWEIWTTSVLVFTVLYLVIKFWFKLLRRHQCVGLLIVASVAILVHSYETRIMSFMIDRPLIGAIESVEDLIGSKVLMKLRKPLNRFVTLEGRLNGIPIEEDSSVQKLDGVSAYYGLSPDTEVLVERMASYDERKKLVRYQVLREYFGMQLGTYIVMRGNPIKELLYWTQRRFFEGGLLSKWIWDECEKRIEHWKAVNKKYQSNVLQFNDFYLVWALIVCGFFASFIIFLLERFFRKM